jgi:hypothetical protein
MQHDDSSSKGGGGIMRVERCELHERQLRGGVLLTVEDIKEKEEEGKGRRRREEGVCSSPNSQLHDVDVMEARLNAIF